MSIEWLAAAVVTFGGWALVARAFEGRRLDDEFEERERRLQWLKREIMTLPDLCREREALEAERHELVAERVRLRARLGLGPAEDGTP